MNTDIPDRTSREHPPDFALELLLSGEGAGQMMEVWRKHAAGCVPCTTRLADLAQHTAGYRASPQAHTLRDVLTDAQQKLALEGRTRLRTHGRQIWRLGLPAATAALLIAFFALRFRQPGVDMRVKGPGLLSAVVRRAGETAPWNGGALRPADEVQLMWASPTPGFLAVVARETGGETIVLFPEHGDMAGAVSAGQARPVGASLSITVGSRRFATTACFSTTPTRIGGLLESGRHDAAASNACVGETRVLDFPVDTP